jgi:hypothetical protein
MADYAVVVVPYCCEIRRELADGFAIAARLYAEAVANLAVAGISPEKYIRLRRRTEDALHRAEAASIAFEEHVASHMCFDGSPTVSKQDV